MKQIPQDLNLARGDLMDMEGLLCSGLAAFFTFKGHALYFPTQNPPDAPQFLPRERRLLLPLVWREELLGVLMLHGVRAREVRPLLPALPSVVALCLENLARSRAARTDAVTGLATEDALYARMEDEAARVRAHLDDPAQPDGRPAPLHRLCMGLVVLRLRNGEEMARQIGFAFSEKFLRHVAEACRAGLPSDVLAARVGRYEYALLLSASGRGACHKLARAVLGRMEAVSLPGPLTRQPVRPLLCAGHALYPQDMQGP
ncbi:MAG: diguanylate cyclase, partial [Desulfovibrio fairfieldensis]|nr:diguanylate cyclase [Desulfovibrio fairfieldensis]